MSVRTSDRSPVASLVIPGIHAQFARLAFMRALRRMQGVDLVVILPGGRRVSVGRPGPEAPCMTITRDRFFERLGTAGKLAFGEAYMAGDWQTNDLAGVLLAFAVNLDRVVPRLLRRLRLMVEERVPVARRNTVAGAARNISHHYDLSNELFGLFLDPTMTYSAAIFAPGDTLESAQQRKYQAIAELCHLGRDDHLLEIGTGWGGMAIHAASTYGCRVTTTTISQQQYEMATERVAEAGLAGLVEVLLLDYRQLSGRFSKIVSIEMFEAVGEEYWPAYFAACDRLLAPGGIMAMQTITTSHQTLRESRRSLSWIQKHIFPGGQIPSLEALEAATAAGSRLRVTEVREIGPHYATTLRLWRERFNARLAEVRQLGFDEQFVRMWNFYLAFCEAGFRAGALGDAQLSLLRL